MRADACRRHGFPGSACPDARLGAGQGGAQAVVLPPALEQESAGVHPHGEWRGLDRR